MLGETRPLEHEAATPRAFDPGYAMILILYAYGGWNEVGYLGGESAARGARSAHAWLGLGRRCRLIHAAQSGVRRGLGLDDVSTQHLARGGDPGDSVRRGGRNGDARAARGDAVRRAAWLADHRGAADGGVCRTDYNRVADASLLAADRTFAPHSTRLPGSAALVPGHPSFFAHARVPGRVHRSRSRRCCSLAGMAMPRR